MNRDRERTPKRRQPRLLWSTIALVVVALSAAAGSMAANYETWYCGQNNGSVCTIGSEQPATTVSVALRDNNSVECLTGCHTRVYYYSSSTGSFCVVHSNGNYTAECVNSSGGNYVYSRCITDAGYGSNQGWCWTDWHT